MCFILLKKIKYYACCCSYTQVCVNEIKNWRTTHLKRHQSQNWIICKSTKRKYFQQKKDTATMYTKLQRYIRLGVDRFQYNGRKIVYRGHRIGSIRNVWQIQRPLHGPDVPNSHELMSIDCNHLTRHTEIPFHFPGR